MPNRATLFIKDTGPLPIARHVRSRVDVGWLPEEQGEQHISGMTIGDLAAIHEFGDGMIPMRAPVRRWADSAARMVIQRRILKVANRQVRAQKFDRNQWYRVIRQAVNSMQSRIVAGKITPKNELSTLANKAPEERPLIESKQMVNAMRAEVELRQLGGLAGSRGFRTKAMGEGA